MRARDILLKNKLRLTDTREEVLEAFLSQNMALSQANLETLLPKSTDRITIYRTIKTLIENDIIHKIPDDGGLKYGLCKDTCTGHDHVHFKCYKCQQTTCIDEVKVPAVALPLGYTRTDVNLLIQGTCKNCQ